MKEEYSSTAYTINVYLIAGTQSLRLSRLSEADITSGNGPRIRTSFVKKEKRRKSAGTAKEKTAGKQGNLVPPARKARASASTSKSNIEEDDASDLPDHGIVNWLVGKPSQGSEEATRTHAKKTPGHRGSAIMPKRKRVDTSEEESVGDDDDLAGFLVDDDDVDIPRDIQGHGSVPESDDDDVDTWAFSFTGEAAATPRVGSKPAPKRQKPSAEKRFNSSDIIELSD